VGEGKEGAWGCRMFVYASAWFSPVAHGDVYLSSTWFVKFMVFLSAWFTPVAQVDVCLSRIVFVHLSVSLCCKMACHEKDNMCYPGTTCSVVILRWRIDQTSLLEIQQPRIVKVR
jgi:hypothetical protein